MNSLLVSGNRRRAAVNSLANTLRFEARNSTGGWKIKFVSEVVTGRRFKVPTDQQALSDLPEWLATVIRTKVQAGHRRDKLSFQFSVTDEQLGTIKAGASYKLNNIELTEVTVGVGPRQPTAEQLIRQVERRSAKLKFNPTGDIMSFKQEFLDIFRGHEALGKLHLFVYLNRSDKPPFEEMKARGDSLQQMLDSFYELFETRRVQTEARLRGITFENCQNDIGIYIRSLDDFFTHFHRGICWASRKERIIERLPERYRLFFIDEAIPQRVLNLLCNIDRLIEFCKLKDREREETQPTQQAELANPNSVAVLYHRPNF